MRAALREQHGRARLRCHRAQRFGVEHRGGLHVNADHLKVELGAVNDGGQDDSGPRDIIVTDLHNYGMPFIRYANGDLAVAGPEGKSSCGRAHQRIAAQADEVSLLVAGLPIRLKGPAE